MSRPLKNGLDYFPMDVTTDDKFELIEAKHGLVGFAIIVKLFQKIYKEGYYLDWNEEKLLLFKKAINVDTNLLNDVIKDCLRYCIFNQKLFDEFKILTSSGIQKRYLNACDRRKSVDLIKEHVIVDINSINVDINWINTYISTQSKVKESKVKYIYNEFYDFEILQSLGDEQYLELVNVLYGKSEKNVSPLDKVLKIRDQLTFKEFCNIRKQYTGKNIPTLTSLLVSLDQYTPKKPYSSVYKVLITWINNDLKKQGGKNVR
jgi:hypothetical protein